MRMSHCRRLFVAGLCVLAAAPAAAQTPRTRALTVGAPTQTFDPQGHVQRQHVLTPQGRGGQTTPTTPTAPTTPTTPAAPSMIAGRPTTSTPAGRPTGYRGGDSVTTGGGKTSHGGSGVGTALTLAIATIGVCAIFCAPEQHTPNAKSGDNDDEPTADDLRQNGPHVSNVQPFGAYAVYGFVRNGWPIVVDYDSDPAAEVWISVTVAGRTWSQALKPGKQYAKITYGGDAGASPQPALFVVQSATPGGGAPSRLDIIGMGAGRRAVGSVAIENLSFALAGGKQGGDFAHFGYQAASPFDRVEGDILHYEARRAKDGHDEISVVAVAHQSISPQAVGVFSAGRWNGQVTSSRKPSHGPHRLQVRAWEVDDDASWVSAPSTQEVLAP